MKHLQVSPKFLIVILFFLLLLPSCNNEELFVVEQAAIVEDIDPEQQEETEEEEEDPNTEDVAPAIDAVDDTVITMQHAPVDIEVHLNDINLPDSIALSNTNPSNGVLTINNNDTPDNIIDDTVVYTPNAGFSGVDTFDYTICDATNFENCDTATVTITIEPLEEDIATELKAFPKCLGAACDATGGRGKEVYHVTNLNDSGVGSFRDAVSQSNRMIIFDVSGTVVLQSSIYGASNLTIAGQTAPEGGITIQGHILSFNNQDNIIIRYIRRRQDRNDGGIPSSGLQFRSSRNVVLDHVSIAYGRDESLLVYDDGTNKAGAHTISNCIISEGKTGVILGSNGGASRRGLAGTYSFHHNFISQMHRTPNTAGDGKFEIINNVIYNWQIRLSRLDNAPEINHINNYYKPNRLTQYVSGNGVGGTNGYYVNKLNDQTPENGGFTGKVYTSGNDYDILTGLTNENWSAWFNFYLNPLVQADASLYRENTMFPLLGTHPVQIETATNALNSVLNDVGANKYLNADGSVGTYLDSLDDIYISDALNEEDNLSVKQPGKDWQSRWYAGNPEILLPFPSIPQNTRPAGYDTDGDGMPNIWEVANGFNPDVNDSNLDSDNDGYTNLEEFLNNVDK